MSVEFFLIFFNIKKRLAMSDYVFIDMSDIKHMRRIWKDLIMSID